MITTDKILKEYFYRRDDGGAFFDSNNYHDLHDLEAFLLENDYMDQVDKQKLNELFGSAKMDPAKGIGYVKGKITQLWDKVANLIKNGYRQITSKFKARCGVVEQTIGNQNLQSEFYVTIPAIIEPNLSEFERLTQDIQTQSGETVEEGKADVTAIKGYYNEALTAQFIVRKNKTPVKVKILSEMVLKEYMGTDDEMVVVQLENDKSSEVININRMVDQRDSQLRVAAGKDYDEVKKIISMASQDMADYLINTVGTAGGIILEIYLTGDIEKGKSKADIRLKIKKGARESLKAWSLKMYADKKVNLANQSLDSATKKMCGPEFLPQLEKLKASKPAYGHHKDMYVKVHNIKDNHKNKKLDVNGVVARLTTEITPMAKQVGPEYVKMVNAAILRLKATRDFDDQQQILRELRASLGNPANSLAADIMAELFQYCLNSSDTNREVFTRNLFDVLGFSDKDTDFLMALVGPRQVKAGKSEIIDKHPELDISNIGIQHKPRTVTVFIINDVTKQRIVECSFKEASTMAGFVKF